MPAEAPAITDIRPLVDCTLGDAVRQRASDVHVEPAADGYEIRFRIDGVLQTAQKLDSAAGRAFVTRVMVMARLLTYRLDVPQEGRLTAEVPELPAVELRLAVMPTIHGLRAAIRMPAEQVQAAVLDDLHLPKRVLDGLLKFAAADSGMLILTGPAGSGKTTTIYALLRHIVNSRSGVSIIALEDPVERNLPGVTQIEVSPFGQLTYEKALRSILRQDPQILVLGEIRDSATASLAVQAALSGHRLITTLHAATAGGAIARLIEMGIEPYQITSSLLAVVSQRLARRKNPDGGYRGRIPLAEYVEMDQPLRSAILKGGDSQSWQRIYGEQGGYQSFGDVAKDVLRQGITDEAELDRVMGNISA
ncbi:MAG TPA: ATPase, T2SS/T4P/T4SS family [Tepidisphaeraceae bacterium]|nr:ATPase, T2SS/T4P/T4SS family [Tepidisphaeraceae bacterium]